MVVRLAGKVPSKRMDESTTEAEYIAASEAAKEGVWIKKFLIELSVFPNASSPLNLYCDNSGAIAQAKESPEEQTPHAAISSHSRVHRSW